MSSKNSIIILLSVIILTLGIIYSANLIYNQDRYEFIKPSEGLVFDKNTGHFIDRTQEIKSINY